MSLFVEYLHYSYYGFQCPFIVHIMSKNDCAPFVCCSMPVRRAICHSSSMRRSVQRKHFDVASTLVSKRFEASQSILTGN